MWGQVPDPRNPGDGRRNRGVSFSASRSRAPIPMVHPHEPRTAPLTDASNATRVRLPIHFPPRAVSPSAPRMQAPADDPLKPGQAHPYPCERHHCRFIHAKARRPFSLPATTVGGILTYTAIPRRVSTAKFHLSSTCWRTRPSTRSHNDMIPTAYRIALLPRVGEPSESGRARTASPTVAQRGSGTTPATKLACTNIRG